MEVNPDDVNLRRAMLTWSSTTHLGVSAVPFYQALPNQGAGPHHLIVAHIRFPRRRHLHRRAAPSFESRRSPVDCIPGLAWSIGGASALAGHHGSFFAPSGDMARRPGRCSACRVGHCIPYVSSAAREVALDKSSLYGAMWIPAVFGLGHRRVSQLLGCLPCVP